MHRPHVGAGAADALIKVERIGQRGHHTCATVHTIAVCVPVGSSTANGYNLRLLRCTAEVVQQQWQHGPHQSLVAWVAIHKPMDDLHRSPKHRLSIWEPFQLQDTTAVDVHTQRRKQLLGAPKSCYRGRRNCGHLWHSYKAKLLVCHIRVTHGCLQMRAPLFLPCIAPIRAAPR